jgi:hypothetical protein
MDLESLRPLIEPGAYKVSVSLLAGVNDNRGEIFQNFAETLISLGLTRGTPPETSILSEGPFFALSVDGRLPRHFYQTLPTEKEWSPFFNLIRTLATGEVLLSPETIADMRNYSEPLALQVLITPDCPFCALAVNLANQMAAVGPSLESWIIDAQLFPEWRVRFPVKSAPALIIGDEVIKTGLFSEGELVTLLKKKNSPEYLEQLYRNDLLDKRMDPALKRLLSRPQDLPIIAGLIKAEEFGIKLGAMAMVEQIIDSVPEKQTLIFDALIPLLKETSDQVVGDTAYLLSSLQEPRKEMVLKGLLEHPNPEIREIAQEGLNGGTPPMAGDS